MREEVLSAPGFRRWNFKHHGSHIDRKPPHIDQKVRASPQDSIILTAQCFSFSTATCQTLDWNHTALWLRCCSLHTRACPGRMIRIFASQINDRFPQGICMLGSPSSSLQELIAMTQPSRSCSLMIGWVDMEWTHLNSSSATTPGEASSKSRLSSVLWDGRPWKESQKTWICSLV